MIKFDEEKVLLLHQLIIESTGGTNEIRDHKLLDSALNSAFQTFDDKELYPTKEEKGAKLGYSLVSNHAFLDGNKRIGIMVMLSFLEINGIHLSYTDNELIDLGIRLASDKISYEELLSWVKAHKKQ